MIEKEGSVFTYNQAQPKVMKAFFYIYKHKVMAAVLEHPNIGFDHNEVVVENISSSWQRSDTDCFRARQLCLRFLL